MTRKNISDAVNEIDNRHIEEAADFKRKRKQPAWVKWCAIAACLCLVIAGTFAMGLFGKNVETATVHNGTTISFSKTDVVASELALNLQGRALTTDEIKTVFGEMPIYGDALFTVDDESFVGIDGHYGDMKLVISMSGNTLMDTAVVGEEKVSMIGDVPVNAGVFVTKANSQGVKTAIYYAQITLNDYSIYIENAGVESERENVRAALVSAIEDLIASHFDFSCINWIKS